VAIKYGLSRETGKTKKSNKNKKKRMCWTPLWANKHI